MRFTGNRCRGILLTATVGLLSGSSVQAQLSPLVAYGDDESVSCCDLVNTATLELGVLADTRELIILTGFDLVLGDTFVEDTGEVFFAGDLVGYVEYAEDGDGFRTLWWLSSSGTVVDLDLVTFEPFDSGLFAFEFFDVPCDGCLLWDDALSCEGLVADEDLDGISDCDDLCPSSSLSDFVDIDGCACDSFDSDLDGVSDCDDLCDFTPVDASVDEFGCEIVVVIDDGVLDGGTTVNNLSLMCGSVSALSLAMMFAGLVSFRSQPRRHVS